MTSTVLSPPDKKHLGFSLQIGGAPKPGPHGEGKSIAITPHSGPITFSASIGGTEGFVSCELNKFSNSSIQNPVGGGMAQAPLKSNSPDARPAGNGAPARPPSAKKSARRSPFRNSKGTPKLTISPTASGSNQEDVS
jgi:hypothetical protein